MAFARMQVPTKTTRKMGNNKEDSLATLGRSCSASLLQAHLPPPFLSTKTLVRLGLELSCLLCQNIDLKRTFSSRASLLAMDLSSSVEGMSEGVQHGAPYHKDSLLESLALWLFSLPS